MNYILLAIFSLLLSSKSGLAGSVRSFDFSSTKKILNKNIKSGETFYTGCRFVGKKVDLESCGYVPKRAVTRKGAINARAHSIEWEHVVPAHAFGQSTVEWRNPSSSEACFRKSKPISSRECARKMNQKFRQAEGDAVNLVPEIGELNGIRSNYSMAEIPGEEREFGKPDVEVSDRKFEPRDAVKGDVARIYKYMEDTYPGMGIISEKNIKLFYATVF